MKECQKNTEKHARPNQMALNMTCVDEDAKLALDFLKKMVIRDTNMSDVKCKLNSTRSYRKQLMLIKETDVRHMFPFFMSNPELVIVFLYL